MRITDILLVDDERDFVETLAERLELRGLSPRVAFDGPGALEAVAAKAPDLVVLDLYMPGLSGAEVLHSIKARHPDLPVILLTGHGSVDDGGDGPVAAAFACHTKPLSLDDLWRTLEAAARSAGKELPPLGEPV